MRQFGMRFGMLAMLLSVALALPSWGQKSRVYREGDAWVEEITGTMPAAREVRIFTDTGSVQVQGNAPQIIYQIREYAYAPSEQAARRQFEQLRVTSVRTGDAVSLEGRLVGHNLSRFHAEVVVQVPRNTPSVKVETRAGSLALRSVAGNILATTKGGSVKLDDIAGHAMITTGGGDVEIGSIGSDLTLINGGGNVMIDKVGGLARVKSGGGRVRIGSSNGSMIETGAGNIEVLKCGGDLQASSGGGNLMLGDIAGSVQVDTAGGSVRVASVQGHVRVTTGGGTVELFKVGQDAQVENGAGAIMVQFIGGRGAFGDSMLHTASGNVTVYLPSNLGVTVHASTDLASGAGIQSAFPELRITKDANYGSRAAFAEGALNGGGPVLRVRTIIGQIDFRRLQ